MGFYKDCGDDNNVFLIGYPHRNKYDIYNMQSVVNVPASRYGKKWVVVGLGRDQHRDWSVYNRNEFEKELQLLSYLPNF